MEKQYECVLCKKEKMSGQGCYCIPCYDLLAWACAYDSPVVEYFIRGYMYDASVSPPVSHDLSLTERAKLAAIRKFDLKVG